MKFAEWAKAYVALAGLIAQGLAAEADFLPAAWQWVVRAVLVVAAAFAVWRVPNADPPAPAFPWPSEGPAWDDLPEWWDEQHAADYEDDYF